MHWKLNYKQQKIKQLNKTKLIFKIKVFKLKKIKNIIIYKHKFNKLIQKSKKFLINKQKIK